MKSLQNQQPAVPSSLCQKCWTSSMKAFLLYPVTCHPIMHASGPLHD